MGCMSGKPSRMAIRLTPEMREGASAGVSEDPERPVIDFPYNANRLKSIDY